MHQVRATDYRSAALKFEQQQRLFQELGGGSGRNWKPKVTGAPTMATKMSRTTTPKVPKRSGNGIQRVNCGSTLPQSTKNSGVKCRKCGKTGHMQKDCSTNMGRVKCFKCGQSGHIGANCQASSPKSASSSPSSSTGKGSNAAKAKPAAKAGRGKGGRKGKMHEVFSRRTSRRGKNLEKRL